MLVDTHCHLNLMVKQETDVPIAQTLMGDLPLTAQQIATANPIIQAAQQADVTTILTVGTTLTESKNSIQIAQNYAGVHAIVGIHPNDCAALWRTDFTEIKKLVADKKENKIIGIGETGLDFYWPGFDKQRQRDAFKAHIELALAHDLALAIHLRQSRDEQTDDFAKDELLEVLLPYKKQITRGVMHCFSHDKQFADTMLSWGFSLGIGGVITYPKNEILREIVRGLPLEKLVLETDAPFLPPQIARGKQNHPKYIAVIAQFLAELKGVTLHEVSTKTTQTAQKIFGF